jgi:hypothetical protein
MIARLRPHAFESAIAIGAAALGVVGVLGIGAPALYATLPDWLARYILAMYALGGGGILVGLLTLRPHAEIAGLILLGTSSIVRVVANAAAAGIFDPVFAIGAVFHLVLAVACVTRIVSVIHGEVILPLHRGEL